MTPLINLLPWRRRRGRRRRYLWGGGLLIGLILQGGLLSREITQQKTYIGLLESQSRSLHARQQTLSDRLLQQHPREDDSLVAESLSSAIREAQVAVQSVLAALRPESCWLRALSWQPYRITLEGTTQSVHDLQDIERLLTALPDVRQVKAGTVLEADDGGFNFTFWVEYGGA